GRRPAERVLVETAVGEVRKADDHRAVAAHVGRKGTVPAQRAEIDKVSAQRCADSVVGREEPAVLIADDKGVPTAHHAAIMSAPCGTSACVWWSRPWN